MVSSLRTFLRLLPCRAEELPRFRSNVIDYVRGQAVSPALSRELEFHLRAQEHLKELNLRYFPQSGLSERELIAATARRVGFKAPEWDDPEPRAAGVTTPPHQSS